MHVYHWTGGHYEASSVVSPLSNTFHVKNICTCNLESATALCSFVWECITCLSASLFDLETSRRISAKYGNEGVHCTLRAEQPINMGAIMRTVW
jgi:hypothetical protein